MEMKYNPRMPSEISDEEIREEFSRATMVEFSAKRFNYLVYRKISFGSLHWLPTTRVLSILDITPQAMKSVFSLIGNYRK